MRKIKVLLVTGTYELCTCLQEIINHDAEFHIVAQTSNAYEARDKIIECKPDLMILSNDLPRMEGIVFLKKLIPQYPMPVIMLAPPSLEQEALRAGAKGFVSLFQGEANIKAVLHAADLCGMAKNIIYKEWDNSLEKDTNELFQENLIIAMGASTGGTEALFQVIKQLKEDIPGIVMVQHMPEGFTQLYASRLNNECRVVVKEAKSGDIVKKGQVLLAPGDKHMRLVKVNGVYQVECRMGPRVSGHCPSVDVLFSSVAKIAGKNALGVIMTGMGSDGAKGLKEMHDRGAQTIGQDEKTSVVYGMPKVAYELGAVDYQLPLEQIANKLYNLVEKRRKG